MWLADRTQHVGGQLTASNGGAATTDRLGSLRARGTERYTYYPYGEARTESVQGGGMYAGLESPLRNYSPGFGRFDRPDPLGLGAVKMGDPGSWNRFAYVQGDPVNYRDPGGLVGESVADTGLTFSVTGYGVSDNPSPPQASSPFGAAGLGFALGFGGSDVDDNEASVWEDGPVEDPCDGLAEKMNTLIEAVRESGTKAYKGLRQRYEQIPRLSGPARPGHIIEFRNRQKELRNVLKNWTDNDCGDPPPSVIEWVNKPVPGSNEQNPQVSPFVVVGTGAGAYIFYKVVRLLPSLFFPPSLPVNVLVP
jgi:RHS repeat-associated protein